MEAVRKRAGARAAAALLLIGGGAALAACDTKDRAVDCAKLAISVSRAYDELERAALTSALDQDSQQFTDAVSADADKVRERSDNVDIQRAAESVGDAAEAVRDSIVDGGTPDLSPLGEAVGELTRVCAPAG